MQNIFITGVSSGLGFALAQAYLAQGDTVYAIGKTFPQPFKKHKRFFFLVCDVSHSDSIQSTIKPFIQERTFALAILNAGILGEINTLTSIKTSHIEEVMNINVWANKELIDILATHSHTSQIVAISSGASVNGNKGWGAYSLSKATLNMLVKVYAKELSEIHFTSLAPGIIKTPMVNYLIEKVDDQVFPSLQKLKNSPIQTPQEAAKNLLRIFPTLLTYESGNFIDIRTMKA